MIVHHRNNGRPNLDAAPKTRAMRCPLRRLPLGLRSLAASGQANGDEVRRIGVTGQQAMCSELAAT